MAQYDFGWGSSQYRNRPMSTEIGDAGDPFRDSGPRMRDRVSQGPVSPWTPGPRSTSTSGLKPLFHQPTTLPPPALPPSALPPSAPTPWGQIPDDPTPTPTETIRSTTPPGIGRGAPTNLPSMQPFPKPLSSTPSLQNLFMGRGDPVAPIPPARQFPRSTEAIGDQGDPILPASNRGRPNQYWGTKGTPSWSYSDGPLANIDVPAYSGQSASKYLKLLNSLGLGSFYRGQGHGPIPDPSVKYPPPRRFTNPTYRPGARMTIQKEGPEEDYNRARQAYNRGRY